MGINSEDECWIALAIAILQQAMTDYEYEMCNGKKMLWQQDDAQAIKQFFLSEYGQFLSFGNGAAILRRCDKNVELKRKKYKSIKHK